MTSRILRLSEQCESTKSLLDVCSHRLMVAARLVETLVRVKINSPLNGELLRLVLSPDGDDWHRRIHEIGDRLAGGGVSSLERAKKIQMFVIKKTLEKEAFR